MSTKPGSKVISKGGSKKLTMTKLAPLEDVPSGTLNGTTLSSTKSIQHKKDLLEAVRRTNPASVNTAPGIFWNVEGALKSTVIDDSDVKQQLIIVENGVNYNVKKYNDLRITNERLILELKAKLDELDDQKGSFEELEAMKKAQTEESLRIESLKVDTVKVEQSIHQKVHYTRRLEHILNRLKANQLKFDAHMTGMEETMRNIQKDGAEIRLMRRGLDAGLGKAVIVLEETKQRLSVSRKDREVLLDQRKAEFKNARLLSEWLRERERMKVELGIELRGNLTLEEERFLKSQIDDKQEKSRSLQRASEEGQKKLQSMEEAFTKLKQITGVQNVGDMHEKFSNQKSNKLQLEVEVKDAEHRLAQVKKAYARQESLFSELKSSGGGVTELNRESIHKLEEAYGEARNEQKFIKAEAERIATVLLGLHQGAQGLLQRAQPYQALAEGGVFELTQLGEESSPWTETVEALTTAEHVLTKMTEAITGDAAAAASGSTFDDDEESDTIEQDLDSIDTLDEAPNHANNVRIKSKRFLREAELEDEAVPAVALEEIPAAIAAATTAGVADSNGVATNVPPPVDDAKILSRLVVKKISAQTSQEAKRKEDMQIRRKKLLDRMEKKGEDAAGDEKQDDARIALTAKFKAQKASGNRLSVDKAVPTLPDGVTLRDDPMTKTIAFLQAVPKLT